MTSSPSFFANSYSAQLLALADDGRQRSLSPQSGLDFSSNDYLGLAGSVLLRDAAKAILESGAALGSGGSRLLRGNHAQHEALEAYAAAHFGHQAMLFFGSGFAANSALLATLPQRGDLIIHDALIHASTHEGLRLTRADYVSARHNDVQAFADVIADFRRRGGTGRIWLTVESLYSMDGDIAPLAALKKLADAHDAFLIIDDAHGGGAFGLEGRGLADDLIAEYREPYIPAMHDENVITLRTLGKAFGVEGALLGMSAVLRDFMVNRARSFIFSTAPSPFMAALAQAAIKIVATHAHLQSDLDKRISLAMYHLRPHCKKPDPHTPIFPVIMGNNDRTMQAAAYLQKQGFDVRGIRPPTVPKGTSRLRIVITNNVKTGDIISLADSVDDLLDFI
jgi:8-amino-7-oxononanoate synthase